MDLFGLPVLRPDLAEQERSGFRYANSVYQAEYSRNLLFRSGAQMEKLFDQILDRTRSPLGIPALRTLFGLKARPHHNCKRGPPAQDIVTGKLQYGLAWFRIRFGRLQLKACTKGEHVLHLEATVHNFRGSAVARRAVTDPRRRCGCPLSTGTTQTTRGLGDPLDVAVWQASHEGEPAWQSPWGHGRPGWHAECAAMALHAFGPAVDVQAGGGDLRFPHHAYQAAMAEAFTGVSPFARVRLNAGVVRVAGAKMAKSAGNPVLVSEFLAVTRRRLSGC